MGLFASSEEYKIDIINSAGETVSVIKKDESPKPITKEGREYVINMNYDQIPDFPNPRLRFKLSKKEIEKLINFPKYEPYFYKILSDTDGNIYVCRYKNLPSRKSGILIDFFDKEGRFLYTFVLNDIVPFVIQRGHLITLIIEPETEYHRVVRYKIKNWDQIRGTK